MALGARLLVPPLIEKCLDRSSMIATLKTLEETTQTGEARVRCTVQQEFDLGRVKPLKRQVDRNPQARRLVQEVCKQAAICRCVPGDDGALADRFRAIRHDLIKIQVDDLAQSFTARAGAQRAL